MASSAQPASLTLDQMFSADYWRAICPHLHVDSEAKQADLLAAAAPCCCSDTAAAAVRRRLIDEGYASLKPDAVRLSTPVEDLTTGRDALPSMAGLPRPSQSTTRAGRWGATQRS